MRLDGATALVTGGARGIGREFSRQLAAAGAHVVMVGRSQAHLAAAAGELGPHATAWPADLSDRAQVDRLIRDLPEQHPGLSIVINNAAVQTETDFLHEDALASLPALRAEIALNLDAAVALSAGLLPLLRRQKEAAIVNVTTGLAIAPKKSSPVYCGSKAALRTFTRALRYQCEDGAPHVRVIEAMMPLVDTEMTQGRGRGKISAEQAAAETLAGLRAGRSEIFVGKAKLLRAIARVTPGLAFRILRDG